MPDAKKVFLFVGQSPTYIDWILENEANVKFQSERMLAAWNFSMRKCNRRGF